MKRRFGWLLGLLVSAVFLYLALRGLHLPLLWEEMQGARYWWLVPGVAVYMLGLWVRAWQWHYLLRPVAHISTKDLFAVITIGYMGNNIFPARAGEVLRTYLLYRKWRVPFSAGLATVLVQRVYDGLVMLLFVFVNLPEVLRLTDPSGVVGDIRSLAVGGTVVFLGVLGGFMAGAMFPNQAEAWLARLGTWLPPRLGRPLVAQGRRFLQGLQALGSPWEAWMIFLTAVLVWLLETAKYWFVMHAFDFQVSFFALMLMNGVVNLATILPSAPGYVGTFDAPGIAILEAYGVAKPVAAAYTLVLHAALWLPVTLLGLLFFIREGLHWREWETAEGPGEAATGRGGG